MKLKLELAILSIFVCTSIFSQGEVKLLKTFFTSGEAKSAKVTNGVDYMTMKEKQFIFYMNLCRLYPKKFAEFYLAYLQKYDENGYRRLKRKDKYYYSLYRDLRRQKPLLALKPSEKMFELAKCWALESGKKGVTGHNRKKCKKGYSAECCSYSNTNNTMHFLFNLLVDDTISSLGHRKAILNNYRKAGVSIQKHKAYGYCIVIDFSY